MPITQTKKKEKLNNFPKATQLLSSKGGSHHTQTKTETGTNFP